MMHGPLTDQQDHSGTATGNPLVAVLGQALSATEVVAIALVVAASAGALGTAAAPTPVEA